MMDFCMNNKKITIFAALEILCLHFVPVLLRAQTQSENYIMTETMLDASGKRSIKTVQYYDGLGRPSVLAAGGVNTSGKYVYSMTEYDMMGRESKKWLPSVGGTTPDIISSDDIAGLSDNTYKDKHAYSITSYDALDRPLASTTPGDAWNKENNVKSKNVEYITNKEKDVKRYTLTKTGLPTLPTDADKKFYEPCTLTGERTTDEDGHTLEVYKDLLGNVVLERRNDGSKNNDTYFVYERGLLRAVVPPMGSSSSYVYRYKYDGHGRCIEKILPGCQPIKYWYDKYGRMAFMQDNRMKSANKYRFYLYDGLSRLVVQGMCTGGAKTVDTTYAAMVVYGSGGRQVDNSNYYVDTEYKLDKPTLEIVNYYDGYDCVNTAAFSNVKSTWNLKSKSEVCTTTLQTAQMVTDNNGKRYFRVMYYDEKGRCTEMNSTSIDGYFIKTNTSYSFTDKPTKTVTRTYKGSLSSLQHTLIDSIKYDTVCDLPEKEYIKLDNNPEEYIADNVYDDLGRLKESKSNNGVIRDTYSYNLHGWLTNHQVFDSKIHYAPLFKEKLYYADGPNARPCSNGNISAQVYTDAYDQWNERGYLFSYDGMDRLTDATYRAGTDLSKRGQYDYSESVRYNANSAMTKLERMGKSLQGASGYIDNISFTYSGNQVVKAKDSGMPSSMMGDVFHFAGDNIEHTDYYTFGYEYCYDGCGALTGDMNKGIRQIKYDFNGLPTSVWFKDGSITEYVYTADGTKLKTIHRTAVEGTAATGGVPYLSEQNTLRKDSTLYVGAYEFCSNSSDKYFFANGYIGFVRGRLDSYFYYAKDHLGNVRHVDRSTPGRDNGIVQITNYYPFGGILNESFNRVDYQNKLYNGKELDRMHGLNLYDYSARQYDAALGQFTSMDPLCEKYYHISPYAYCAGNPVKYVDPTGCLYGDFVNADGEIIGNDGLDDGKLYVLKTSKSEFVELGDNDNVSGAGVDQKKTIKFIKANSGNSKAFADNDIAYKNSVEIESSKEIRSQMVAQISKDDGRGGRSDANNREYGGEITDEGLVMHEGPVSSSPSYGAHILLSDDYATFHSHPSGSLTRNKVKYMYTQHPSSQDIINSGGRTCYVFGRRNGTVYIYDSNGVQATIPTKYFINQKKK